MTDKPRQTSTDNTAQTGVNAVEAIFLSMKWLFRRQLESDFGIDAQAEIVNDEGYPTGQLVAMQIKSGPSFFRLRGEDYVFRGEQRHLDYWDRHSLPVILVMHNPVDGMTLWQRVERHLVTQGANGTFSMKMPQWQKLEAGSADAILRRIPRSDPESDRRNRMMLDLSLIRRVSEKGEAYVTIDEWVNKSLNFRAASIYFDEYDASPAYAIEFYMNASNVSAVFDWIFPWLEFGYLDMPQDDNGEVMEHVFEVKLNYLGQAFLMLEDYYVNGAEPNPDIDITEPTGEIWDDEEFAQYQREKAQQEDWEAQAYERWQNERK
jgi:Domain of unknown function (DUF4365)